MRFRSVLVANRGEIACRVLRTVQAEGYRAIAVYSDADADAPHVRLADEAVQIGPAAVGESYLDPARILAAARATGAEAIHPGYGFLSENAAFARAVTDAGLTWIGPPPAAIDAMGDKARAKARMRDSGVPCVPGFDAEGEAGEGPDDATLTEAAASVGFPLLVKAAAGGGGRGMRRVDGPDGMAHALSAARAEARHAFGSGRLLLERLVEGARHVEVQVLADEHGAVLHLGERDCSVQRRHQKVIEEAPSPAVDAALRARMGEAACAAARAVGYVGAGTVELLLGADGSFYFLEMNTRLQVEHPVTECVTGLDLVALQLRVAQGEALPFGQADIRLSGHAVEARLYAEDPAAGYLPQTGRVLAWEAPTGEGIRVDHGLATGRTVTPDYDPMLAKVIAWGPDRATAVRRLARALDSTVLVGVRTNRAFLARVLRDATFQAGEATTAFLDSNPSLTASPARDPATLALAVAAFVGLSRSRHGAPLRIGHTPDQAVALALNGEKVEAVVRVSGPGVGADVTVEVDHAGSTTPVRFLPGDGVVRRVRLGASERTVALVSQRGGVHLQHGSDTVTITAWDPSPAPPAVVAGDGRLRAPTAGRVLAVRVSVGDPVSEGDAVALVEAMKIETTVRSDVSGTVSEVRVAAGDNVAADTVLVVVTPSEEA